LNIESSMAHTRSESWVLKMLVMQPLSPLYLYINMCYIRHTARCWSNFRPHYNLNLQSIAVNGQLLPIDQDVFATGNNRGTIVDSGTTLAYLVQEAYDPFLNAVSSVLPLLKVWYTTLRCSYVPWFYCHTPNLFTREHKIYDPQYS
jgi:hypothetical protein